MKIGQMYLHQIGDIKVVTDWREVVDSNEIDIIDICAPNNMHN